MPARVSEAFVLRTYPFQEADLIVSFFTRDQGKLRGAAKRARRPRSPYGSGLERLTEVRASYYQRETVELVRLDGCEIIRSQFGLAGQWEAGMVLDFMAEVSDQLLPAHEPNEKHYRLLAAVLADLRSSGGESVWRALLYFTYWAVRLAGVLPEARVSAESRQLAAEIAGTPISQLAARSWTKETGADLRRFLVREMETLLERRLATAALIEAL